MSKVLNIGIEAQRIFRKKRYGMDIVAIETIKALQQIDTVNQYYIFSRVGEKSVEDIFPDLNDNFHFVLFGSGDYVTWEQFLLPKKIQDYDLDLLHCTANTAPLKLKVPLYLLLHDIIYLEKLYFNKGSWYQRLGNLYRSVIVPKIVPRAKRIGTVSNYERQKIIAEFNLDEEIIQTYHNAYSDHFRLISKDDKKLLAVKKEHKLPEDFLLLFFNEDPRKNFVKAIEAYISLRRAGLTIPLCILNASTSRVKHFFDRNNAAQYWQDVICISYLDNSELVYFYNLAKVFLFISTRESFGIPVLEAMASGTPVITSNSSSLPEVAGDAALKVDPDNVEEIAEALELLLTNQDKHLTLTKAGFERVKQFSWQATAQKWLNTYKAIARETVLP
ncbi:glycosyltransferase family 1 protein [Marivirga atlantica]|uniref:Glycosyltransferase family 4 protein n=1 Tax=Marivirga atlantica TaxID=1548457 RepID=A0A937AIK9_9BACT|nr:glycosyltransferase family 1 protein [Marivirga atlantica]MBL0766838.1 glycosyltransferase family 4 protein [Marivirga atlantica]